MQLIITTSQDVTSDIIIPYIQKHDSIFRFNTDLYENYNINVHCNGFEIADPTGRTISNAKVTSLYWRKPWMSTRPTPGTLAYFEECQRKYLIREIVNICNNNKVWMMVEPFAEHRIGKVIQMQKAKDYFNIPEWCIVSGNAASELTPTWLVKTLYSESVEQMAPIVKPWTEGVLSSDFQWFLQKEVENAVFDVTVVYVCGKCFAYRKKRELGKVDWRIDILKNQDNRWEYFKLDISSVKKICKYMEFCELKYGRLDFLLDSNNELMFLEVNPNGQYAWLDLEDDFGMLTHIAQNSLGI